MWKHNKVNSDIKAENVRVIDSAGVQVGIFSLQDALSLSESQGFDLVEIQPNLKPPVVKLMDYGKYIFKKEKILKKKQSLTFKNKIKEIKFRPNTDKHDYSLKIRQLSNFLKEGMKVKVTIWFKGREILHKEFGLNLLDRICNELSFLSRCENPPKIEGKFLIVILNPYSKK